MFYQLHSKNLPEFSSVRSTDPKIVLYIWLTHALDLCQKVRNEFFHHWFSLPSIYGTRIQVLSKEQADFGLCTAQSVDVFHASPFGVFLIALLNMAGFMKFRSLIYLDFTRGNKISNSSYLNENWKKKSRVFICR